MTLRRTAQQLFLILSLALGLAQAAHTAPADAIVKKARDELQKQHYEQARAAAAQATQADPKDYRGHYYLAMAEMGLGHAEAARVAVARARQLAPESAKAAVEKLAGLATSGEGASASSKQVFVKCSSRDVEKPNGDVSQETLRVSDDDVSSWLSKEYAWTSLCKGSNAGSRRQCSIGPSTITASQIQRSTKADGSALLNYSLSIDRTSGAYEFTMSTLIDYGNGEVKDIGTTRLRGQCEATTDPAANVAASKF